MFDAEICHCNTAWLLIMGRWVERVVITVEVFDAVGYSKKAYNVPRWLRRYRPGCTRCWVGRWSRSSSPGGGKEASIHLFSRLWQSRGYFVASEWAQGGCTTLYQLPEEGKKVCLLLHDSHLCFSLSLLGRIWYEERGSRPRRFSRKLIHFIRQQNRSQCVIHGSRVAVQCAYAEAFPAYGLYSDCVSVQD